MAPRTLNLDLSGVDETNLIPEGHFPFIVEKVELKDGPQAPYLAFTLEVIAEGYEKRKLFVNFSLSEKALWRVKGVLRALGLPTESLPLVADENNLVIAPPFMGRSGIASVIQAPYEGRMQNQVADILPLESTPAMVPTPASAAAPAGAPSVPQPPKLTIK